MKDFHLHVYFSPDQQAQAAGVRQALIHALPGLTYKGNLIGQPIGPHPLPMFELHIPADDLEAALPIVEKLRQDLSVLIHPILEEHLSAHTIAARWLGRPLPLDLDFLRRIDRLHGS